MVTIKLIRTKPDGAKEEVAVEHKGLVKSSVNELTHEDEFCKMLFDFEQTINACCPDVRAHIFYYPE